MSVPSLRLRLEALAPQITALGDRTVAELLIDIAGATAQPDIVLARAEAFARLSPEMVRAARAERFPPRLFATPNERRRA